MSFIIWGAGHLGVPSQWRFIICWSEGGAVLPYLAENGRSEGARLFLIARIVHCGSKTRTNSQPEVEECSGWRTGPCGVKGNVLISLKEADRFW